MDEQWRDRGKDMDAKVGTVDDLRKEEHAIEGTQG